MRPLIPVSKTRSVHDMNEIIKDRRLCTGCSACSQACPSTAIYMEEDAEGFLFPRIDAEKCTDCGLCVRLCPVNKAIGRKTDGTSGVDADTRIPAVSGMDMRVFACYSKDDDIRSKSSSGGVFTMLAHSLPESGRVIFGAEFDEFFNVKHGYIEDLSDLDRLRRSKYVQSDTGDTFSKTKSLLEEGRHVLYCGTPCQIAGLKAFLGRDYPCLLTCDLACHGVPSPKVWRMYLGYIKKKYSSEITAISFRDKSKGWKNNRMLIDLANGKQHSGATNYEIFFIGFGKSIFNRSSCYKCSFRLKNSKADITLADFWGVEKLNDARFKDDKGISCIITHTSAGDAAMTKIGDSLVIQERLMDEAVRDNPRLVSSCPEPEGRKSFFKDLDSGYDFDMLRRKYMDNFSLKFRLKRLIKSVVTPETVTRLRKLAGR